MSQPTEGKENALTKQMTKKGQIQSGSIQSKNASLMSPHVATDT